PYNTYRNYGLPPTPISNPGLDVIDAALHPETSPYYFYLSGKDGVIHYAKTFEEHKINKEKYLR
ncbi:MAG TPA: endolytic transglycosylase MltG, partial [Candidatus Paceibacterota bacterium]